MKKFILFLVTALSLLMVPTVYACDQGAVATSEIVSPVMASDSVVVIKSAERMYNVTLAEWQRDKFIYTPIADDIRSIRSETTNLVSNPKAGV